MSTFTSLRMKLDSMNDKYASESKVLNMSEIERQINLKQKYEEEGILIKKWEGQEGDFDYLSRISIIDYSYLGIINNHIERNKHGLFIDNEGHKYLGNFNNNQRHKLGVYLWTPRKLENGKMESELYMGSWKKNKIDAEGLYLWMTELPARDDFDLADFDVFLGRTENSLFKRGTYMTKKGDNYYLYHGSLSPDGKKNDTNAYYYSSHNDILVNGTIVDDHFVNGYKAYFKDDPSRIDKLIYCTFNEDGTTKTFKDQCELWQSKVDEISNNLHKFHSLIMEEDYFGAIYNKYKTITALIAKSNSLEIYDDPLRFVELVGAYTEQKIIKLYRVIETELFPQN